MNPGRVRNYLILAAMPALFSSNLIIGRAAIESVGPWTLAFLRWTLAALVLLPLAWRGLRAHGSAIMAQGWRILALGILGMWICGGIVYVSLRYTTATHATLIYTTSPVMVVLMVAIRARQALPLPQWLGIGFAMTGVAVTAVEGDLAHLMRLQFNLGDLGILVCAISWALYSLLLKHRDVERIPPWAAFFAIAAAGSATLLPCMAIEILTVGGFPSEPRAWASVAGIVIFSSVGSYSTYQYSIRSSGPTVTSIFMYLIPAYGIALAVIFLGEPFRAYHAVGLGLILGGVILATGMDMLRGVTRHEPSRPKGQR